MFISELAGKDLGIVVVLKFLLYYSPNLVPLVLPLTILVSSIMTFGGFSEYYEFAAMKSSVFLYNVQCEASLSLLYCWVF